MKNFEDKLERAFMQVILDRLGKKKRSFSDFAVEVWPAPTPKKTAVGKFRQLRTPSPVTGRCQSLSLGAAHRMAQALGEELGYLLAVARERIKNEESETD